MPQSEAGVGGVSCLEVSQMSSYDKAKRGQADPDVDGHDLEEDLQILHEYKQTKAFATLLRRQGHAVRRI